VAAYEDLPESLKRFVDGLRAIHTNTYDDANPRHASDTARRRHLEVFTSTVFETEHPVVRIHPEAGERALLLGGFAHRLVGLSADQSRDLLHLLADRVTRPENTVRWREPSPSGSTTVRAGRCRRCHDIQRHRGGLRNPWPPARAAAGAAADRTSGTEQRTDQLAEGGHLIAHLRHRPGRETELEMGAAESGELGQVLGDLLR